MKPQRARHGASVALVLILGLWAPQYAPAAPAEDQRGREILAKFLEVNRYWLSGPPAAVQNFSYVLQRVGGTQEFAVPDPRKTPRARLQGITYSAMVHQLARAPQSAKAIKVLEENGRVRLDITLEPALRGACGNGVENSWNGYYSLGGATGFLVLDAERFVPLEGGIGRLRETFGEYVEVDTGHYVPLAIRVNLGEEAEFEWRFRVYEPGLWLFDEGHSAGRRLAWIEKVKVNSMDAKMEHATRVSLERAASEKAGQERLEAFVKANRHWLLPSLQNRRWLVYEYRQEAPYLERVSVDGDGNVLVRLEASKDSPGRPTRQRFWLPDGRSYTGDAGDGFIYLQGTRGSNGAADYPWGSDRMPQHLAMGLGLDCAVTRLVREPDTFWAEVRSAPEAADKYVLVLHSKRDARLFTGTMLSFTSWSYMHDVKFNRSEILCDAATHRPLEEKDFAGESELKGHYFFEEWSGEAEGHRPLRIRAVIPHSDKGQDQSLEMDARFQVTEGIWLLQRVESGFRNGSGSTGVVTVVRGSGQDFRPIQELLAKAQRTEEILGSIAASAEGAANVELRAGEWTPAPVKAAWTDQARESLRGEENETTTKPILGIYRARATQSSANGSVIELDGISTAAWKEFQTEWKVTFGDGAGGWSSVTVTNEVRAESAPASFVARLELPATERAPSRIRVEGTVRRMTGAYHGHGVWFRLAEQ